MYNMKILVIEDEPKIARAIRIGLEQERAVVEVCYDGPSGLNAAQSDNYDAIVLDRMLPGGMDGVEICKKLRQSNNMTPILLLTAKGQVRDKVEGLNGGADDYLVKPFSFDELLARIRALIRRPKNTKHTTLQVSDLVLDPTNATVCRANQTITLSRKEFALCEYMMQNAGQVLSKDMMIQNVWDFDANILPNTVEAFVGYLRNKIDRPFSQTSPALIKTVRGFGYKIEEPST